MPGVGAKRWAKFAKHLAERGYRVHVITTIYNISQSISWSKDIDHENIIIHRFSSRLPNSVLYGKSGIWGLLTQKLWYYYSKKINFQFDDATQWSSSIIEYTEKLIYKESIETLFVTGAPFSQLASAAIIKRDIANLKLIVDYRDAWNSLSTYQYNSYFWRNIGNKKRSINDELFVLYAADKLIFVTKGLREIYCKQYPLLKHKMEYIYSGYEESTNISKNLRVQSTDKIVIYTGNLAFSRLNNLERVAAAMDTLNKKYKEKSHRLVVYSDFTIPFSTEYLCLAVFPRIGVDAIQEKMQEADYCLSINADEFDYAVSAKVFDYMANGKRIIHISRGGELSEYLSKKGQIVINSAFNKDYIKNLERIYFEQIETADYSEMSIRISINKIEKIIND